MKCIDEEIPFEIPKGWEWCRLGSVAFYKKGPFGSSITKSMFIPESENAIKVYEQKNAIYKDAEIGEYYISTEKFDELKGFQVFPGDIIVSCAGTIGETYIMPKQIRKGIINQALMRIKLYNHEILDFYLMYFDFVIKNQANEQGKGTAIKNIPPFDILKNFLIPLPPIEEQYRIRDFIRVIAEDIDYVDENRNTISALIAQSKSKILDLAIRGKLVPQDPNDEPASALLERIEAEHPESKKKASKTSDNSHYTFDIPKFWMWAQVGEVGIIITGNTPSKDNKKFYGDEFPFYKPTDLEQGINVYSAIDNLSLLGYEVSRQLPLNTILVTCIGATIGKVGLIKKEGSCNQQINALIPYSGIDSKYFYYCFTSPFFQTQIRENASATTLPIINKNKFESLCITLPPLQEQNRIVQKIEDIFSSLDEIANSIKV